MLKRYIKMSFLISFLSFVLIACEKDDNGSADRTNGRTNAMFNPDITYGTMIDQAGNIYKVVTIGTQTWMAENLRTTKYNDGTSIPNVTDDDEWSKLTMTTEVDWSHISAISAYCNYNNTVDVDTIATFGRLYNYYAVSTHKLCPTGWHVSTEDDWTILIDYLGGESVAGGKLKEAGTMHWVSPNTGATNETGFTALPGSWRSSNGSFSPFGDIGISGFWWPSPGINPGYVKCYIMAFDNSGLYSGWNGLDRENGFSVRCVKDY